MTWMCPMVTRATPRCDVDESVTILAALYGVLIDSENLKVTTAGVMAPARDTAVL